VFADKEAYDKTVLSKTAGVEVATNIFDEIAG